MTTRTVTSELAQRDLDREKMEKEHDRAQKLLDHLNEAKVAGVWILAILGLALVLAKTVYSISSPGKSTPELDNFLILFMTHVGTFYFGIKQK